MHYFEVAIFLMIVKNTICHKYVIDLLEPFYW